MPTGAWTNEMGDHTQWFSTGDWLSQPLGNVANRHGSNSPVIVIPDSQTVWRDPSFYDRTVINIRQPRLCKRNIGVYENVCTEQAGTLLVSHLGGRWAGASPSFDSNMLNETQTSCLLKIAAGKAQIGVGVAEGKQVYNMLANTSLSLLNAYRSARRGDLRGLVGALNLRPKKLLTGKSSAETWLEYQYGWRPLMSDIHSIYGVLGDTFDKVAMLVHSRSTRKHEHSNHTVFEHDNSYTVKEKCLVRIDARVEVPRIRAMSQIGLINPLSIAWEVVPFSFVLDWFCPVGNVLEAASASSGLSFMGGSYSQTLEGSHTISRNLAWDSHYVEEGLCLVDKFATRRSVLGDFPTPLPYFREKPFNTSRVANAAALWRALL